MGVPHLLYPFLLMDIQAASTLPGFPGGSVVKNLPASVGDLALIPGSGRSPGEANGSPLQCSYLGSPMDRGSWSMKSQMSQRTQRLNNSKCPGCCNQCCSEHQGARTLSNWGFLWIYVWEWDFCTIWQLSFQVYFILFFFQISLKCLIEFIWQ